MNSTELMTSFAQAILAMNRAVEASDQVATSKAIAEVVRIWSLYVGRNHAITMVVERLNQALEDSN